jgi:hypothetical protein
VGIFFSNFSLSFVAAILLLSGLGHLSNPADFRQVLRSHGVFPSWLAGWIAIAVCLFELLVGGLAALALRPAAGFVARVTALAAAAGAGAAFGVYLRRLLSNPSGPSKCGCSPLSAPLTRASLAPSIGLAIVSVVGFAAMATLGLDTRMSSLDLLLPCLWGMTLAGITLLYPAAVLQFLPLRSDS